MGHGLSERAERVVENLSRRRFMVWAGRGALVTAGALGIESLGSEAAAFAPCDGAATKFTITPDKPMKFEVCTAPGSCPGPIDDRPRRFCAIFGDDFCLPRGGCRDGKSCFAKHPSLNQVVIDCSSAGQQKCSAGEVRCVCTARVRRGFASGTVTCGCDCG